MSIKMENIIRSLRKKKKLSQEDSAKLCHGDKKQKSV